MNILLDENISPYLAPHLHRKGIVAEAIPHLGMVEAKDYEVWGHAFANDEIIVTIDREDYLTLAAQSELHTGLIILRATRLSREQQWAWIEPAIDFCLAEEQAGRSLVNRVVEIVGVNRLTVYDLPA